MRDRFQSLFLPQGYRGVLGERQSETELEVLSSPNKNHSSATTWTQIDEDAKLLENSSIPEDSSQSGWIDGVYLCAKASCLVLVLNLILIATSAGLARNYPNNGFSSSAVIYQGSCTVSGRWDTALHLIINMLSTAILAASNYCMQTLVAPTREEIDRSHQRRQWLDIGGASIRNLFAIGRYRMALWVVLLVTATPFHLLYNSIIFQSLSANELGMVIGPYDLDAHDIWNLTTPALEQCFACSPWNHESDAKLGWHDFASSIAQGNYTRLTWQQCEHLYPRANQVGTKALVLLANNLTVTDGGNASILASDQPSTDGRVFAAPYANQSSGPQGPGTVCQDPSERSSFDFAKDYWLDECLAITAEEHCQLLYSPPICIIIVLTASVKVVAMFLAARVSRSRSPPLLTVGDAVASFVTRPDPTTKKMCWLSRADVQNGVWELQSKSTSLENSQHEVIAYKGLSSSNRWGKAPSKKRWLAIFLLMLTVVSIGLFIVVTSALPVDQSGRTPYWLKKDQFSQFWNAETLRDNASGHSLKSNMLESIMLANIPQLFITITYYYYNNVLTSMLVAAEYSSYGATRKPLRVTWPVPNSQQRSTYWLSIPYQYAIPILVIHMILHWLVSQSMFYIQIIPYNVLDQPDYESMISSINFSPLSIFLAFLVAVFMALVLVALAFRRFQSAMPLAGSCSAAISAACHPPKDEIDTAVLGPVMWGETIAPPAWVMDRFGGIEEKGHCSFTSLDAARPELTKLYA